MGSLLLGPPSAVLWKFLAEWMEILIAKLKAYYDLTKAPAIALIIMSAWMGGVLAEPRNLPGEVGYTLGVALIFMGISAAGSLCLNQWMERSTDALMQRTKGRPIPSGRVTSHEAFAFGIVLFLGPLPVLWWWANGLCAFLTFLCGFSYLIGYTLLKTRTSWSTWVGAIPGALLPWMGWSIFRSDFSILFINVILILYFWQIPHTLIISLKNFEDYRKAGMKLFPMFVGEERTRKQVLFQTLLLDILVLVPILAGQSGPKFRLVCFIVIPLTLVSALLYWLKPSAFIDKFAFRSGLSFIPLVVGALVLERV